MSEKKTNQAKKTNNKNSKKKQIVEQPKKNVVNTKTTDRKTNSKTEAKVLINPKQDKKSFWANANELTRLIVVFLVVVGIFLIFYVITSLIKSGDSSETNKDNSVAVIQYDEILVGEILNQNKGTYYVLATEKDDSNLSLYVSYVGSYTASKDADKVYTVDLSSVFNNKFIADENNFDIDEIKDIKFKETTLLKIENKQITEYYEGKDDIVNYLKELIG